MPGTIGNPSFLEPANSRDGKPMTNKESFMDIRNPLAKK